MTGQDGQRKVRVLEAHTLADCADWESCWWQPHRLAAGLPEIDQSSSAPAPRAGLAVTVEDVRRAVGRLQAWLDDETASPTILGSILLPLLPVHAGLAGSDEAVEAQRAVRDAAARVVLAGPGEWIGDGTQLLELVTTMVAAVEPFIAARVRAEAVAEHRADLQHRIEVSTPRS